MSRFISWLRLGAPILLATATAAHAEGADGLSGPRSTATVQISVSVAPRFSLAATKGDQPSGKDQTATPTFASNLSSVRYSIVRAPLVSGVAIAADLPGQVELLLITPE